MIGVYWGRFNPPHKVHMKVIKKLLKEVDLLIIAIGSSEFKNTKRNPFDGKERTLMIKAYLKEERVHGKVKVVTVRDGKSYSSAIKNLFSTCDFDVIFFSDEKNAMSNLMKNKIKIKKFKRKGAVSSTRIRDAIAKDKKWTHLTGKSVARLIEKMDGINRIKKTYGLAK